MSKVISSISSFVIATMICMVSYGEDCNGAQGKFSSGAYAGNNYLLLTVSKNDCNFVDGLCTCYVTPDDIKKYTASNQLTNFNGETVGACTNVAVDSSSGSAASDRIQVLTTNKTWNGVPEEYCEVQVLLPDDTNSTGQCYITHDYMC